MLGSTDTHNATPGNVREDDFKGHLGTRDSTPVYQLTRFAPGGIEAGPSGLAVVWAEENSRDALFAALRRREVYGTSGPRHDRPLLRRTHSLRRLRRRPRQERLRERRADGR